MKALYSRALCVSSEGNQNGLNAAILVSLEGQSLYFFYFVYSYMNSDFFFYFTLELSAKTPTFHWIFEVLNIDWKNSTLRSALIPARNVNIDKSFIPPSGNRICYCATMASKLGFNDILNFMFNTACKTKNCKTSLFIYTKYLAK